MNYDEIFVGNKYEIDFVDTDYPCRCPCHTNSHIRHCAPCCWDRSFHGILLCVRKDDVSKMIAFKESARDFLSKWFSPHHVVRLSEG